MKLFSFSLAAVLFAVASLDADNFGYHAGPVTGGEKGVLVLAPGMNGNGKHFLAESPWMDFAERHQLGVIALAFRSDAEPMYDERRRGYYWPEQGSGPALLEAVEKHFGADLPILIYGFSGGAQFTSRFAEWAPERVAAWAAYSAQFWDPPAANDIAPPGIVACGDHDGSRWQPSFAYFYQGRELGKPWTWVSIPDTGHTRHRGFEEFVREFFAAVWENQDTSDVLPGVTVDVGTTEKLAADESVLHPGLIAWLPDENILQAWMALHTP